jgi:hypothetical protein
MVELLRPIKGGFLRPLSKAMTIFRMSLNKIPLALITSR